MTVKERNELNLYVLQALKKRYNMTAEEMAVIDFVCADLETDPERLAEEKATVTTIADRAGKTWSEKAAALFSMAYCAGKNDGIETMGLRLYKFGVDAGQKCRRRK